MTSSTLSRSLTAHGTFWLLGTLVAAALVSVAGCGTTEGFGSDVKNLGGSIEDSAAKNK